MKAYSKTLVAASALVMGLSVASLAAEAPAASGATKGPTLSVADAIQIAEKAAGGKATAASLDEATGSAAYEVTLTLADGSTKSVLVDAVSGAVRAVSPDNEGDKENLQESDKESGQETSQEHGEQAGDAD